MDERELKAIVSDIQASPTECEWVEIKHNNYDPQTIGEYVSALSNGASYMGQSRGYMAWGLDNDTHKIVGTSFDPKELKIGNQELENWIATQLSPRIDFSFREVLFPEGRVVVTSGLHAGDQLITSGNRVLYDGVGIVKNVGIAGKNNQDNSDEG